MLVTSANALAYNVVHYLTIQMTSAVTTTVLGMVRQNRVALPWKHMHHPAG